MLTTAVIMAVLIYIGVIILFKKLPRKMRTVAGKFDPILDVGLSVGAFFMLGQTVTALIASAILGILVSVNLFVRKKLLLKTVGKPKCQTEWSIM